MVGPLGFGHSGGGLKRGAAKEAVGEWTADALVKEHKEQSDAGAFVGEAVGVAAAIALQQSMGFHFAQVVAQLGKRVSGGREAEAGNNRFGGLGGAPAPDPWARVQQHPP